MTTTSRTCWWHGGRERFSHDGRVIQRTNLTGICMVVDYSQIKRREAGMDVSATLKTAWKAVESAGLPEQIQEAAFREAVRLLAPTEPVSSPARGQSRPPKLHLGSAGSAGNTVDA